MSMPQAVTRGKLTRSGFTLIELLVTLLVLGVLSSAAVQMVQLAFKRHKEEELRRDLTTIRDAIDAYKKAADEKRIATSPLDSGYPPDLRTLVVGVVDATSPDEKKIYFLRRIPADPMATSEGSAPEDSWGKRSYVSEPTDPQEGSDVYDVYSKSAGIGLNGVAYRDW